MGGIRCSMRDRAALQRSIASLPSLPDIDAPPSSPALSRLRLEALVTPRRPAAARRAAGLDTGGSPLSARAAEGGGGVRQERLMVRASWGLTVQRRGEWAERLQLVLQQRSVARLELAQCHAHEARPERRDGDGHNEGAEREVHGAHLSLCFFAQDFSCGEIELRMLGTLENHAHRRRPTAAGAAGPVRCAVLRLTCAGRGCARSPVCARLSGLGLAVGASLSAGGRARPAARDVGVRGRHTGPGALDWAARVVVRCATSEVAPAG